LNSRIYLITDYREAYPLGLITVVGFTCALDTMKSRYFMPKIPKIININRAEKIAARSNIEFKNN